MEDGAAASLGERKDSWKKPPDKAAGSVGGKRKRTSSTGGTALAQCRVGGSTLPASFKARIEDRSISAAVCEMRASVPAEKLSVGPPSPNAVADATTATVSPPTAATAFLAVAALAAASTSSHSSGEDGSRRGWRIAATIECRALQS